MATNGKTFYEKSAVILDRVEAHWRPTLGKVNTINYAVSIERPTPELLIVTNETGYVMTFKVRQPK